MARRAGPVSGAGAPGIERVDVEVYTIPTDAPESDGTLEWSSTTLVVVHAWSGGEWGLGYTYASSAAGVLVRDKLAAVVQGLDAFSPPAATWAMARALRNDGQTGLGSMAISAVDCALWDLKARLLGVPLATLLGQIHDRVPIYGSGGFTSYDDRRLAEQLRGWVERGIRRVKMKVGRDSSADPHRVEVARRAIGDQQELYVDANGGYGRKLALEMGRLFYQHFGVTWYEEPLTSDDLEGLRLLRDHGPPGLDVAAGEYGWNLTYFRRMLDAGAVDCLQADVTRCMGITGFMHAATLCQAAHLPLSAHCAPAQHVHACCAIGPIRHLEYFHDHARIEAMLFDGCLAPEEGFLRPDLSRSGMGLAFKHADARKFAA